MEPPSFFLVLVHVSLFLLCTFFCLFLPGPPLRPHGPKQLQTPINGVPFQFPSPRTVLLLTRSSQCIRSLFEQSLAPSRYSLSVRPRCQTAPFSSSMDLVELFYFSLRFWPLLSGSQNDQAGSRFRHPIRAKRLVHLPCTFPPPKIFGSPFIVPFPFFAFYLTSPMSP